MIDFWDSLLLSACLSFLSLYVYISICYSIYLYIYYKWEENRSSQIIMRRKARERGINRRRYYERQQRMMGMSGKERKLSYCTANSTITIASSRTSSSSSSSFSWDITSNHSNQFIHSYVFQYTSLFIYELLLRIRKWYISWWCMLIQFI
jgi:hypothetical protein